MNSFRDSVYIIVAIGSIALAACQPSEADVDAPAASVQPGQPMALDLVKGSERSDLAILTSSR